MVKNSLAQSSVQWSIVNPKSDSKMIFVLDWEICLCLCAVYCFWTLSGLDLGIKHAHISSVEKLSAFVVKAYFQSVVGCSEWSRILLFTRENIAFNLNRKLCIRCVKFRLLGKFH